MSAFSKVGNYSYVKKKANNTHSTSKKKKQTNKNQQQNQQSQTKPENLTHTKQNKEI